MARPPAARTRTSMPHLHAHIDAYTYKADTQSMAPPDECALPEDVFGMEGACAPIELCDPGTAYLLALDAGGDAASLANDLCVHVARIAGGPPATTLGAVETPRAKAGAKRARASADEWETCAADAHAQGKRRETCVRSPVRADVQWAPAGLNVSADSLAILAAGFAARRACGLLPVATESHSAASSHPQSCDRSDSYPIGTCHSHASSTGRSQAATPRRQIQSSSQSSLDSPRRRTPGRSPVRVDDAARPFVCEWPGCDGRFTRAEHLRRHAHIHTGEKPFACPVPGCAWRSNRRDNWRLHMCTHRRHGDAVPAEEGAPDFVVDPAAMRRVLASAGVPEKLWRSIQPALAPCAAGEA